MLQEEGSAYFIKRFIRQVGYITGKLSWSGLEGAMERKKNGSKIAQESFEALRMYLQHMSAREILLSAS